MNGETRGVNSTLETINAAANAIASADNLLPQASSAKKRRWGIRWSIYWCFGSNRQKKRIGHAVVSPETTEGAGRTADRRSNQALSIVLPFVAPPSSPASFLQSEPPSATQSPAGLVSLSDNMYSPSGPASIFAIGPYSYETQLVSPPAFSSFNTEPSTAPFTPPPDSLQLTTPSSPELPFARLLGPHHQNGELGQNFSFSHYEFHNYQLYPGSPMGQLVSPSSSTSSPFPDRDFTPGHSGVLEFRTGSGFLTPNAVGPRSGDGFMLNPQNSDIAPLANPFNGCRNDETAFNHRVSFEITAEQVVRCVEKKPAGSPEVVSKHGHEGDENSSELADDHKCRTGHDVAEKMVPGDSEVGHRIQKHRSITLESSKEFNFASADGGNPDKPTSLGSDWWANEKGIGKEVVPSKNWSFFPVMQPSGS